MIKCCWRPVSFLQEHFKAADSLRRPLCPVTCGDNLCRACPSDPALVCTETGGSPDEGKANESNEWDGNAPLPAREAYDRSLGAVTEVRRLVVAKQFDTTPASGITRTSKPITTTTTTASNKNSEQRTYYELRQFVIAVTDEEAEVNFGLKRLEKDAFREQMQVPRSVDGFDFCSKGCKGTTGAWGFASDAFGNTSSNHKASTTKDEEDKEEEYLSIVPRLETAQPILDSLFPNHIAMTRVSEALATRGRLPSRFFPQTSSIPNFLSISPTRSSDLPIQRVFESWACITPIPASHQSEERTRLEEERAERQRLREKTRVATEALIANRFEEERLRKEKEEEEREQEAIRNETAEQRRRRLRLSIIKGEQKRRDEPSLHEQKANLALSQQRAAAGGEREVEEKKSNPEAEEGARNTETTFDHARRRKEKKLPPVKVHTFNVTLHVLLEYIPYTMAALEAARSDDGSLFAPEGTARKATVLWSQREVRRLLTMCCIVATTANELMDEEEDALTFEGAAAKVSPTPSCAVGDVASLLTPMNVNEGQVPSRSFSLDCPSPPKRRGISAPLPRPLNPSVFVGAQRSSCGLEGPPATFGSSVPSPLVISFGMDTIGCEMDPDGSLKTAAARGGFILLADAFAKPFVGKEHNSTQSAKNKLSARDPFARRGTVRKWDEVPMLEAQRRVRTDEEEPRSNSVVNTTGAVTASLQQQESVSVAQLGYTKGVPMRRPSYLAVSNNGSKGRKRGSTFKGSKADAFTAMNCQMTLLASTGNRSLLPTVDTPSEGTNISSRTVIERALEEARRLSLILPIITDNATKNSAVLHDGGAVDETELRAQAMRDDARRRSRLIPAEALWSLKTVRFLHERHHHLGVEVGGVRLQCLIGEDHLGNNIDDNGTDEGGPDAPSLERKIINEDLRSGKGKDLSNPHDLSFENANDNYTKEGDMEGGLKGGELSRSFVDANRLNLFLIGALLFEVMATRGNYERELATTSPTGVFSSGTEEHVSGSDQQWQQLLRAVDFNFGARITEERAGDDPLLPFYPKSLLCEFFAGEVAAVLNNNNNSNNDNTILSGTDGNLTDRPNLTKKNPLVLSPHQVKLLERIRERAALNSPLSSPSPTDVRALQCTTDQREAYGSSTPPFHPSPPKIKCTPLWQASDETGHSSPTDNNSFNNTNDSKAPSEALSHDETVGKLLHLLDCAKVTCATRATTPVGPTTVKNEQTTALAAADDENKVSTKRRVENTVGKTPTTRVNEKEDNVSQPFVDVNSHKHVVYAGDAGAAEEGERERQYHKVIVTEEKSTPDKNDKDDLVYDGGVNIMNGLVVGHASRRDISIRKEKEGSGRLQENGGSGPLVVEEAGRRDSASRELIHPMPLESPLKGGRTETNCQEGDEGTDKRKEEAQQRSPLFFSDSQSTRKTDHYMYAHPSESTASEERERAVSLLTHDGGSNKNNINNATKEGPSAGVGGGEEGGNSSSLLTSANPSAFFGLSHNEDDIVNNRSPEHDQWPVGNRRQSLALALVPRHAHVPSNMHPTVANSNRRVSAFVVAANDGTPDEPSPTFSSSSLVLVGKSLTSAGDMYLAHNNNTHMKEAIKGEERMGTPLRRSCPPESAAIMQGGGGSSVRSDFTSAATFVPTRMASNPFSPSSSPPQSSRPRQAYTIRDAFYRQHTAFPSDQPVLQALASTFDESSYLTTPTYTNPLDNSGQDTYTDNNTNISFSCIRTSSDLTVTSRVDTQAPPPPQGVSSSLTVKLPFGGEERQHGNERGREDVLTPATSDGTQGLPPSSSSGSGSRNAKEENKKGGSGFVAMSASTSPSMSLSATSNHQTCADDDGEVDGDAPTNKRSPQPIIIIDASKAFRHGQESRLITAAILSSPPMAENRRKNSIEEEQQQQATAEVKQKSTVEGTPTEAYAVEVSEGSVGTRMHVDAVRRCATPPQQEDEIPHRPPPAEKSQIEEAIASGPSPTAPSLSPPLPLLGSSHLPHVVPTAPPHPSAQTTAKKNSTRQRPNFIVSAVEAFLAEHEQQLKKEQQQHQHHKNTRLSSTSAPATMPPTTNLPLIDGDGVERPLFAVLNQKEGDTDAITTTTNTCSRAVLASLSSLDNKRAVVDTSSTVDASCSPTAAMVRYAPNNTNEGWGGVGNGSPEEARYAHTTATATTRRRPPTAPFSAPPTSSNGRIPHPPTARGQDVSSHNNYNNDDNNGNNKGAMPSPAAQYLRYLRNSVSVGCAEGTDESDQKGQPTTSQKENSGSPRRNGSAVPSSLFGLGSSSSPLTEATSRLVSSSPSYIRIRRATSTAALQQHASYNIHNNNGGGSALSSPSSLLIALKEKEAADAAKIVPPTKAEVLLFLQTVLSLLLGSASELAPLFGVNHQCASRDASPLLDRPDVLLDALREQNINDGRMLLLSHVETWLSQPSRSAYQQRFAIVRNTNNTNTTRDPTHHVTSVQQHSLPLRSKGSLVVADTPTQRAPFTTEGASLPVSNLIRSNSQHASTSPTVATGNALVHNRASLLDKRPASSSLASTTRELPMVRAGTATSGGRSDPGVTVSRDRVERSLRQHSDHKAEIDTKKAKVVDWLQQLKTCRFASSKAASLGLESVSVVDHHQQQEQQRGNVMTRASFLPATKHSNGASTARPYVPGVETGSGASPISKSVTTNSSLAALVDVLPTSMRSTSLSRTIDKRKRI